MLMFNGLKVDRFMNCCFGGFVKSEHINLKNRLPFFSKMNCDAGSVQRV